MLLNQLSYDDAKEVAKEDLKYQVRDESGALGYFDTFQEAYESAKKNPNIWKISWSTPDGARIRLVRDGPGPFYLEMLSDATAAALLRQMQ